LLAEPELLEQTENACRSAAWFWHSRGLNELADAGEFRMITKRINGGYNGLGDRQAYYNRAKEVLHA
jgi:putative chitinase